MDLAVRNRFVAFVGRTGANCDGRITDLAWLALVVGLKSGMLDITRRGERNAGSSGESASRGRQDFASHVKLLGNQVGEVISTDYRLRATAADGLLRAVAVSTTEAARSAQVAHQAWPVAAAAMGRLMSAAVILGADLKEGQGRLTVEVSGDGPLGRVVAETRPGGELRARVQNAAVDLPLREDGKLAVGQAVGREGFFRVLRQDARGDWYQSQVELQNGEIGEDFLHFMTQSEQVPSAVAVGVLVGEEGLVIGSGGVMVQALPGCPPSLVNEAAENFSRLTQISRRLADGESLQSLLEKVLPEPIRRYPAESLRWDCWCDRSNIRQMLSTLSQEDLVDLIDDGGAEVTCHFCRTAYHFSVNELEEMQSGPPAR